MIAALALGGAETLQAHHPLVVAIPAFVPALVIVGVVVQVARKDRRAEREERELLERALGEGPEPEDS